MASKAANTAEAPETREEAAEAPLLDTVAAAIKKMVARGKERGYVTYDELNAALPPEQVSSEQIEDTMTMLSELGVNVVESEEAEEPAAGEADGDGEARRRAAISTTRISAAPTIRCACICARWARSSCCRARARSRSPSASRPAAR